MRNVIPIGIVAIVAIGLAGCAGTTAKRPASKVAVDPPQTITIAPHAQSKKYQDREDRRVALESGAKVQGEAVVR